MKYEIILQPKQLELGKLCYRTGPSAATMLGMGGARAGGKSGALRRIMLDRRMQRKGTTGAIIRRVYDEVKRNHIDKYLEEFPVLRKYYRTGDKEFALPNGSRIVFAYAENQQEVDRKFWGVEYYDIFVDQAEQFSERELITIDSCRRWPGAPENDCKTCLFFNPGGIGTEYLRRIFAQKRFHHNERPENYQFIHAFGWDNYVWFEHLGMTPEDFYALPSEERFELFIRQTSEGRKLDAMPPSLRAGHLLGSFDSFAGQYFAGVWDESKLILTAKQEESLIQQWWQAWIAHDDGFVHHAAVTWWRSGKVSPKLFREVFGVEIEQAVTVAIVVRAHTVAEVEPGQLVRDVRGITPEGEAALIQHYFLSADAWEKDSKGHSTADTIREELARVYPAADGKRGLVYPAPEQPDNGRIGGWRFLYAMMKKTADVLDGRMNPTRETDDYEAEAGGYSIHTPLLFISSRCIDVIEAIPMAVRDDKHPGRAEDVLKQPTKADDVLDSVRYGAKSMLNPKSTPLAVEAKEFWAELKTESVHSKAMAMRRFEHDHRPKQRRSGWAR